MGSGSGYTSLLEWEQSVQLLKIDGWSSVLATMPSSDCVKTSCYVLRHKWEVELFPAYRRGRFCWIALRLIFLGEVGPSGVRARVTTRLVDPTGNIEPSKGKDDSKEILQPKTSIFIWFINLRAVESKYVIDDSVTVECTISMRCQPEDMPPSDMHLHFGELLKRQTGTDVTFIVDGESFTAHKIVLAARSPVFMAEFFGNMEERSSQHVQIEDMEAAVFEAMLHFIYTDSVPELDDEEEPETRVTMAQHLLAAADRYGLGRLKVICESKLCFGISVDTVATTLALAEQHNCALLRARCISFITASPKKLDAVMATEGYKHLAASCPWVLTELYMGRKTLGSRWV